MSESGEPGEPGEKFQADCKDLRAAIKSVGETVMKLHESPIFLIEELYKGQHGEMHANLTLSYRHLEDAAMRLGKAIQAYDHGISVYDRQKGTDKHAEQTEGDDSGP